MVTVVSWWPATLLFGATDLTKGVDGIVDGTIFCGPGVAAFDGICVGMLFARTGATGTFNGTALPMFSGTSNRGFFFRGVLAGILFSGTSNLQSRLFLQRSARLPHGLPLTQPRHASAMLQICMHDESHLDAKTLSRSSRPLPLGKTTRPRTLALHQNKFHRQSENNK